MLVDRFAQKWIVKISSIVTNCLYNLSYKKFKKISEIWKLFKNDRHFDFILLKPYTCKQDTHLKNCVAVKERLAVMLQFLESGDDYQSNTTCLKCYLKLFHYDNSLPFCVVNVFHTCSIGITTYILSIITIDVLKRD